MPIIRYSLIFIILVFTLFPDWIKGQDSYRFERMATIDEAFTQSITYDIAQDSLGNIWVATEAGALRYNGHTVFPYYGDRGMPDQFGNRVRTVYVGQRQTVWIGGPNGPAYYDPSHDRFVADTTEGEGPVLVVKFCELGDRLYLAAFNGLWRLDDASNRFERVANLRNLNFVYPAGPNQLLISADDGLYTFNSRDASSSRLLVRGKENDTAPFTAILATSTGYLVGDKRGEMYRLTKDLGLKNRIDLPVRVAPISAIILNEEGKYLVGTDGDGIIELNQDMSVNAQFQNNLDRPASLSSNGVYDLLLDRENILWVATYGGGVNKLSPYGNMFRRIEYRPNSAASISHPFTRAILEDETGRVWFATKNGISIWDRTDKGWTNLLAAKDLSKNRIVMSLSQDERYVYAGFYQEGLYRIDKQNLETRKIDIGAIPTGGHVFSCVVASDHLIWVGGANMDLRRVNPISGEVEFFPVSHVKAIFPARSGGIWAVGRMGLARVKDGRFSVVEGLDPSGPGTRFTTINAIAELEDGRLLLATNGGGLIVYEPETGEKSVFDSKSGLPSDIVQGVVPRSEREWWVSTIRGVARIELDGQLPRISIYTEGDGLVSTESNYGSFAQLATGELLFGGVEGVSIIDPERISVNNVLPRVVIEDIQIQNQENEGRGSGLSPSTSITEGGNQRLELEHDQNTLTITYAGVSHVVPERVHYRWKLLGLQDEWSKPTQTSRLNLANLESGEYRFIVQASASGDEQWGPAEVVDIIVATPWWRSKPAYLLYTLLGVLLVAGAYRLSKFYINRRNAEKQIAFFNNITHELKTPMAVLLSSLENLSEEASGEMGEARSRIKRTIGRLHQLFEQLLNFHKATDGGKSRHVRAFDPAEQLQELVLGFGPLLKERGLTLKCNVEDAPASFHYDQEIFDKIVSNLISNAIKYSRPEGTIKVRLGDTAQQSISLQVEDDGIGIPEDQQKYILREYYRARNAINSQLPGTGLGLMMVKTMIEKEGGTIGFESVEEKGTTFFLTLEDRKEDFRLRQLELQRESRPPTEEEQIKIDPALSGSKILVVEDNDELREQLAVILGRHYEVITAANGKEGLEKAGEIFPDLIVTDLIMPEMDGMEMSRMIREDIQLNHIPIFMLTVLHNSKQKVDSIESGVSEYMEKPVNTKLLLAKISSTLSWRKKLRERYAQQNEVELAASFRDERENEFISDLEKFTIAEVGNDGLSVQDLCQHVGMSRTSLYMKMKNLIDLSPQDFIIHTRLKYARHLLTKSGSTIKEVAYDCGFSNPKYFSTSFKKKFGQSPRDFRKSLKSEV